MIKNLIQKYNNNYGAGKSNESNELYPELTKTIEFNNDPLNALIDAHSAAIVYYGLGCCNLRCCVPCNLRFCAPCNCSCEDIYKYNALVKIGLVQKFLFTNLAYFGCGLDKLCRFKKVSNLTFSSYNDYSINN